MVRDWDGRDDLAVTADTVVVKWPASLGLGSFRCRETSRATRRKLPSPETGSALTVTVGVSMIGSARLTRPVVNRLSRRAMFDSRVERRD